MFLVIAIFFYFLLLLINIFITLKHWSKLIKSVYQFRHYVFLFILVIFIAYFRHRFYFAFFVSIIYSVKWPTILNTTNSAQRQISVIFLTYFNLAEGLDVHISTIIMLYYFHSFYNPMIYNLYMCIHETNDKMNKYKWGYQLEKPGGRMV